MHTQAAKHDPHNLYHATVVKHWSQAVKHGWVPLRVLRQTFDTAVEKLVGHPHPWTLIKAPAEVLVQSLVVLG
eukprot:11794099-Prorocentrum_lima.AAC.1